MTLHWICLLPVSSTPMTTSSLRTGNTLRPLVPSRRVKHSLDERMNEIWKLLETSLREKIWEEDQNENINRNSLTSYVKWPPAPFLLVENVSTLICWYKLKRQMLFSYLFWNLRRILKGNNVCMWTTNQTHSMSLHRVIGIGHFSLKK